MYKTYAILMTENDPGSKMVHHLTNAYRPMSVLVLQRALKSS